MSLDKKEVAKEVEILTIFSEVNNLMSHFETHFRDKTMNLEVALKIDYKRQVF